MIGHLRQAKPWTPARRSPAWRGIADEPAVPDAARRDYRTSFSDTRCDSFGAYSGA